MARLRLTIPQKVLDLIEAEAAELDVPVKWIVLRDYLGTKGLPPAAVTEFYWRMKSAEEIEKNASAVNREGAESSEGSEADQG